MNPFDKKGSRSHQQFVKIQPEDTSISKEIDARASSKERKPNALDGPGEVVLRINDDGDPIEANVCGDFGGKEGSPDHVSGTDQTNFNASKGPLVRSLYSTDMAEVSNGNQGMNEDLRRPLNASPDQRAGRAGEERTEHGNLWREVSCDYLGDLSFEKGSKSEGRERGKKIRRKRHKSFDFEPSLDPPTRLIEDFLQKQKASGNLSLDMDMNMDELHSVQDPSLADRNLSTLSEGWEKLVLGSQQSADSEKNIVASQQSESSRSQRRMPTFAREFSITSPPNNTDSLTTSVREQRAVSFEPAQVTELPSSVERISPIAIGAPVFEAAIREPSSSVPSPSGRQSSDESSEYSSDEAKIARSPIPSLARLQTRSRLADLPPPPPDMRYEQLDGKGGFRSAQLRSGPMRSGLISKTGLLGKLEEEEDDPLKDADLPPKFTTSRWNCISVVQWVAFIVIMGGLVCSLTVPFLKKHRVWSMALWRWALLILLLFCGRLLSGWIMHVLVFFLERSFLLRKRVVYFVYGLRKGAQNCLWLAFALLAWRFVFDPKVERSISHSKVLPYVTKILNCFLIAAVIWLVKIFFLKVLASSFHVSTYFERIQESLFSQYVLETLSGPPVIEIENNIAEEKLLMEEVKGLKNAGAKIPDLPGLPDSRVTNSGSGSVGKNGVAGARSGMISGIIGPKSGFIAGRSGMLGGKSGMIGNKSQRSMEMRGAQMTDEEGITIDHLHRLNEKNISAWHMKRLINLVRYRGISTLAHAIDECAYESQDVEIQSEWQARAAAKKIFKNVAKPGSRNIVREDLLRFLRETEVMKAIPLFDGAMESGKITKNALKSFVVHAFRERRALALSLNDTKTAVKKLHRVIDVIVIIVIAIILLLILGIATTHLLLFISSQLLLVVFIFGNTCKTVFEAIIFLFVMHPFDVGDRCVIDNVQVVVEEMNILSTLFMRSDGEKIWYPNSVLATKVITNCYCSADTGDSFNFSIHISTPTEKITLLKEKIGRYLASKPNHWTSDYHIVVQEIEDMNRMKMQLMLNHTINFHDGLERQIRRSDLILEVKKIFQELGIEYNLLPQEIRLRGMSDLSGT